MAKKAEFYAKREIYYKEQLHKLKTNLPAWMHGYVRYLELSKQIRTAIAYTRDLITFCQFLCDDDYGCCSDKKTNEIPSEVFSQLTYNDIDEFMTYLASEGHQNQEAAVHRKKSSLRSFFDYATKHHVLENDPMDGVADGKRIPEKPIDRLHAAEVNTLVTGIATSDIKDGRARKRAESTKLRDTAIVTLLLGTGIRVSECAALSMQDLDFEEQKLTVVRKGGKIEEVYFNAEVAHALLSYIDDERPLYCDDPKEAALFLSNRKKRMAVRSIQAMLQKFGVVFLGRSDLHPHTLRKTFGTSLYEATGDLLLVQNSLGHKRSETSSRFYIDSSESVKRNRDTYLY